MDKYTEALRHLESMGLFPAQISAVFADKAHIVAHQEFVLTLDKDAVLEYLAPKVKAEKAEKAHKGK